MARLAAPATLVCVCVDAAWLATWDGRTPPTAVACVSRVPIPSAAPRVPIPAAVAADAADRSSVPELTRLLLGLMARPCRYNLSATAG